MDQRSQLAAMLAGYQPELTTRTRMPGQRPQVPSTTPEAPPGAPNPAEPLSQWTPTPFSPFGGLDAYSWKNPDAPVVGLGTTPIGMDQSWIDATKGVYNSMRARGELPFDVNPPLKDPTLSAARRQAARDSR